MGFFYWVLQERLWGVYGDGTMNSFEFNKIMAGVLVALLAGMGGSLLSDVFVSPNILSEPALDIALDAEPSSAATATKDVLEPITPFLQNANIENGRQLARRCVQCHTLEKSGAQKIGPNLWNIVGAKFAHVLSFPYSKVLKSKKGHWNPEELSQFLYKPREYAPGTKMVFVGLRDAQDRADLIAYLQTLS